jgi:(p)ppGpp synthase/HD superfamily hydrolase
MRLIDVVTLAARLHDGQRDKAGEPYIAHAVRVMLRLPPNASEHEKMAALLHDAVEDVPGAIDAMGEAGVPDEVMAMVLTLTRIDGETYAEFLERIRESKARRVKQADIEDNSDETRLAKLPPDVANRLRTKYGNAVSQL